MEEENQNNNNRYGGRDEIGDGQPQSVSILFSCVSAAVFIQERTGQDRQE